MAVIPGFPGYSVTEGGVVFSLKGQPMKPSLSRTGYPQITLQKEGRSFCFWVHRLVLMAFVGPRPVNMQARHLNGDKQDNRLENLQWGTAKENYRDSVEHGVSSRGERHGLSKLTEDLVREIRQAPGTIREIGQKFGIDNSNVSRIKRGVAWTHVAPR